MSDQTTRNAPLGRKAMNIIGAIVVVVIAFGVTLYALDWWSAPSSPESSSSPAVSSAPSVPQTNTAGAPSADGAMTQASTVANLPKMPIPGFNWAGIAGVNVQTVSATPAVSDQPALRVIAIPVSDVHFLATRFTGLEKGRVYRFTAWVKPEAGANFAMEASDQAATSPTYGSTLFDLSKQKIITVAGSTKPGMSGDSDWQKVWIDIATNTGQMVFDVYVLQGSSTKYMGDGKLGITLGGLSVGPQ